MGFRKVWDRHPENDLLSNRCPKPKAPLPRPVTYRDRQSLQIHSPLQRKHKLLVLPGSSATCKTYPRSCSTRIHMLLVSGLSTSVSISSCSSLQAKLCNLLHRFLIGEIWDDQTSGCQARARSMFNRGIVHNSRTSTCVTCLWGSAARLCDEPQACPN